MAVSKVFPRSLSFPPDVIIEDQKASTTPGGSSTSGSFQTRTLNTIVRNIDTLAALASNQITLPAGTYHFRWNAPAYLCNNHQTRLQNITDGTTVGYGSTEASVAASPSQTSSSGSLVVTITATKVFELQHRVGTSRATDGYGVNASFGNIEVYSRVEITRLG